MGFPPHFTDTCPLAQSSKFVYPPARRLLAPFRPFGLVMYSAHFSRASRHSCSQSSGGRGPGPLGPLPSPAWSPLRDAVSSRGSLEHSPPRPRVLATAARQEGDA